MIEHSRHQMHGNSLESYSAESENLSRREAAVVAAYRIAGTPVSDRTVMHTLQFGDMNSVRPTITVLIRKGILQEVGTETDPQTKRRVRLVTLMEVQN